VKNYSFAITDYIPCEATYSVYLILRGLITAVVFVYKRAASPSSCLFLSHGQIISQCLVYKHPQCMLFT